MRESSQPSSDARVVQVALIVRDALAGYASTETADAILRDALADAGRSGVPRDARELDAFVSGHLRAVVHRRIGPAIAEALRDRLAPFVAAMEHMELGAHRGPAPAEGAAPRRAATVVLAGSPQDARRLAGRLSLAVDRIVDLHALGAALEARAERPTVLVLDCRYPNPLLASPLYALEPSALDEVVVVLWGANGTTERRWQERFPHAIVARTAIDAEVDHVALRIGECLAEP